MKVVLYKEDTFLGKVTVGKTYKVLSPTPIFGDCYMIESDDGVPRPYYKNLFISLEQHREHQLNKILS